MTINQLQSKSILGGVALTIALIGSPPVVDCAYAQERDYPVKVIRFVESVGVGAGADILARAIADQLTRRLHQTVIVDSRPGVAGNLAAEIVAKAPPDGYTLFMSSLAANAINASYYSSLNYDLRRDFAPISKFAQIAEGLFVGPGIPANNLAEFTAMIKAAPPAKYSCASSGTGGLLHLTCEMYKKAAGVDVLHVPYKGSMVFLPELTVGSVTMVFDNIPIYVPLVKAGKMKALAVTTVARSPVLPNVPTAIESGLPGMVSMGLFGLLAPAATPPHIIQLLNREVVAVLSDAALREKMLQQGIEAESSSPAELRDMIQVEIAKWARVIKDAGIRPE